MRKCWWCGSTADTGEHKIKRTVLNKLTFLKTKNNKVKITQSKQQQYIQSSNSKFIKYEKNLCESCNTSKSQKFDRAYDKFFKYIIKNEKHILSKLKIDMKDINIDQEDLFRYFIKSFCCMVDSIKDPKLKVPIELINALNGSQYNKCLTLFFYTDHDLIKYPLKTGIVVTNLQRYHFSNDIFLVEYSECFGWLSIKYIYQTVDNKSQYKSMLKRFSKNYWVGKSRYIIIEKY